MSSVVGVELSASNGANINRQVVETGFNRDVIADDLIHELFHSVAPNNDVSYAMDAGSSDGGEQLLNVTGLLNLALGRLDTGAGSGFFHPAPKAFENADSLAVFTSLLSQLNTDRQVFESNMATLNAALANSGSRPIIGPVLIRLNSPR